MPRTNDSARDKQGVMHAYSGVAITEILKKAGVATGSQLRGKNMAKYLLVSCADGYQVVPVALLVTSALTVLGVLLIPETAKRPLPGAEESIGVTDAVGHAAAVT